MLLYNIAKNVSCFLGSQVILASQACNPEGLEASNYN